MHTTIKKITLAIIIFTGMPCSNWASDYYTEKNALHKNVINNHKVSFDSSDISTPNFFCQYRTDYTESYSTFDSLLQYKINTEDPQREPICAEIYDRFVRAVIDDLQSTEKGRAFHYKAKQAQLYEVIDNALFKAVVHNGWFAKESTSDDLITLSKNTLRLATPELLAVYTLIRHSKENQVRGTSYRTIPQKIKITGNDNIRIFDNISFYKKTFTDQKTKCETRIQRNDWGLKGSVALACLIVFLKFTYFKGMQAPLAIVPFSLLASLTFYSSLTAEQKELTQSDEKLKNYMILPSFFTK